MTQDSTTTETMVSSAKTEQSTIQNIPQGQTIIIQNITTNGNGMGITGFILSLISLCLGWIPFFGWILWILGVVFSAIGVFKQPRGFAIAGLVISFIGFFVSLLFGFVIFHP